MSRLLSAPTNSDYTTRIWTASMICSPTRMEQMMTTVAPDFSRPRGTRFSQTFPALKCRAVFDGSFGTEHLLKN
jgi:hypothetical protein